MRHGLLPTPSLLVALLLTIEPAAGLEPATFRCQTGTGNLTCATVCSPALPCAGRALVCALTWGTIVPTTPSQRRAGRASGHAKALKHARYALWKNPENLTSRQHAKLAWVAKTDPRLHRATCSRKVSDWSSSSRSTRPPKPSRHGSGGLGGARSPRSSNCNAGSSNTRPQILAAIEHGLSNGRIESVNTKIRLITRIAFGFRSPEALIALAMLNLGGHRPVLPGRK